MGKCAIATAYTFAFVRDHLPEDASSILEIGCGDGELAAALLQAGHEVLAFDSNAERIANARLIGVDAVQAEWPCALDRQFDAVLFTRSLHHIAPLEEAITAALTALRPSGKIIVEDFRFELDSPRTKAWFEGLVRILHAAGAMGASYDLKAFLAKFEPDDHRHELHGSDTIAAALKAHGAVHDEDAAYYFRYVERDISTALAEELLGYELALIQAGAIDPLGRRFVLTPSS